MHRRAWVGLLLLGAAVTGEDALPEKARLSATRVRFKVRRNYALPTGKTAVEKPAVRKARLQRDTALFFDVDGNGRFNDLHVDGWSLTNMPYMLPLEENVILGVSKITWRLEGEFVHFRKVPLALTQSQKKTLIQFNTWRNLNGLPAVTLDPVLSDACTKHCEYMERNGMTHVQERGNSGYTDAGAEAGRRSCLSEDGPGMSVLMFYSSFYHRLPLVHPDTVAIGIGNSRRFTAVDGLSNRAGRAWRYPVIIPAPNTFLQPTHFAREAPRPYPDGMKPGFPITLTFDGGAITDAKAEIRLKNAKGPRVRVLVSSPEQPANKKRPDNRKSICVIPRGPLLPNSTWWVRVTYKLDGQPKEHEWLFKTGRARP